MTTNTTALARRYKVEITNDLDLAGGWVELIGLSDFKPNIAQNIVETSGYESDGWEAYEKTFQGWSLTCSLWTRTSGGSVLPAVGMLRDRQVLWGDAARVGVRWYERDGGDDCWQGVALVQSERGNTGVKDPESMNYTLQGDGELSSISNPGSAGAAPVLITVTPASQGEGDMVKITGANFVGTTGVKFGATDATSFLATSDSEIVAVLPTGSAGSVNITVTNATGTSDNFAYTRTS